MKYFGQAPSICSLITASTISHFQRNQRFFVIQCFGDWNDINFHQIKGRGEDGRWQATRWVEILCRFCPQHCGEKFADNTVKKSWGEIQRREKSRPNVVTWPPLYETPAWLYCHLSALSRAPPFSLLSNSSRLAFNVKLDFWRSDKDGKHLRQAEKLVAVIIALIMGGNVRTTVGGRPTIANQTDGNGQYSNGNGHYSNGNGQSSCRT